MLKVLTIVEGIGTVTVLILTLREFWTINKILKQQKKDFNEDRIKSSSDGNTKISEED